MKNEKLKVVFFGTPDFVDPVLNALKENFEMVLEVRDVHEDNAVILQKLKQLEPDLIVVAAFGKIIPKEILEIPKYGALNIHPSLLPKYRGPSPIQQAILNGDKVSGITIIRMDEQMDHGEIVYQEEFKISSEDTFESLSREMFKRSSEILPQVIKDFVEGKVKEQLQDDAIAVYCNRISKADGYFEIDNPPPTEKLDRMIRAYYPWPGVWTIWRVKESKSQRVKKRIVKFLPGGLVQMEGKKATDLKSLLNGYPDFPVKTL